jgi:hypothetical protein
MTFNQLNFNIMTKTGKNFIPGSNLLFSPWQNNFVKKVVFFKSTWNWAATTDAEWDSLAQSGSASKKAIYDKAWEKVSTGVFDSADEQRLLDARKSYESGDKQNPEDTSIRMFINRYIRFNPLVTNDQKIDMGLIVPDEAKTPVSDSNAKISSEQLIGCVKSMSHLIHKNTVTRAGEKSKAKGDGVDEIEIFVTTTEASVKDAPPLKDFQYDGEVKRGLYTRTFDISLEGKRAWYYSRLRIKGKKITFGPPSDPWNALIP